ncbi:hypothetical protein MP228_002557 [Amoeboaphelidium protococcarum]|nr:hypothetical protein MP228_002557 [Amoeboaphelidium protococcarum]
MSGVLILVKKLFQLRFRGRRAGHHFQQNQLFDDTKTGFVGAEKLLRRAKVINSKITMKQDKKFLAQNPILQIKCFRNQRMPSSHQRFMTDNGKEFQNNRVANWMNEHNITSQYCEKDDKKCLGVAERFNRTIKIMIEKYLTSKNTNRWIDKLQDFVQNYNSSFHSSISKIPEQLEMYDEVEFIRKSIAHNNSVKNFVIKRGDFVRLLNKRGAFEKEGQRFTLKVYIVEEVGLNSVRVEGKQQKFNLFEVLKVSPLSQDIDNLLRQKQLDIYRADKRIREREGIEPDRRQSKRLRKQCVLVPLNPGGEGMPLVQLLTVRLLQVHSEQIEHCI